MSSLRSAKMNLRMTRAESNQMLPVRAAMAALALVLSLLGARAAEQAEAGGSVPDQRHAVAAGEQVKPETAKPRPDSDESHAGGLPVWSPQLAALQTGQGPQNLLEAEKVGLGSGLPSYGLVSFCVALLFGIAYMVRQLNNANRQLERRTLDLSRSNEQLKKEIAERRLTEGALRASENFYYSLVETVPQNIFRKDLSGKYTFANRAFCATLGRPPTEIIGKLDRDLFPAELAARFRREDEQLLTAGKQVESEQNYPTPTGGQICVLMIKTPLFDTDGRSSGRQGICWDISERKRAESELVAVHRQLIQASRRVGMAEVATGVLHNVGNVLNSVNVSATLVCEQVQRSKVTSLGKVAALLSEHADVPGFLIEDKRGQQLPGYLKDLAEHLRKEQATMLRELDSLVKNIEHIKEIVYMQQAY